MTSRERMYERNEEIVFKEEHLAGRLTVIVRNDDDDDEEKKQEEEDDEEEEEE
eukprot:m.224281 g.224281  ORF g.224281 m.224281 type:complete len:53 (+) comp33424_c9_seq1:386-544(+)